MRPRGARERRENFGSLRHATFEEDRKGPLLPGYFADIAVLSGNPLTASAEGLLDIRCQATMVGGRWVHGITA